VCACVCVCVCVCVRACVRGCVWVHNLCFLLHSGICWSQKKAANGKNHDCGLPWTKKKPAIIHCPFAAMFSMTSAFQGRDSIANCNPCAKTFCFKKSILGTLIRSDRWANVVNIQNTNVRQNLDHAPSNWGGTIVIIQTLGITATGGLASVSR